MKKLIKNLKNNYYFYEKYFLSFNVEKFIDKYEHFYF